MYPERVFPPVPFPLGVLDVPFTARASSGSAGALLALSSGALLLFGAWLFRRALRSPCGLARGTLLAVLVLLLFSKGFSSYYFVWLVPLLFLVYPALAAFGLSALLLVVANAELIDPPALPFYWHAIFVRHAILLCLAAAQVRNLWKARAPAEGAPT